MLGAVRVPKYRRTYSGIRANLRREVKACMRRLAETKHLTTNLSVSGVTSTGVTADLFHLLQGTSATTRIGSQVDVHSIRIIGSWGLPATDSGDVARLIIYCDKTPLGAAPAVTDILENTSWDSPWNLDKVPSRFNILYDKFTNLMNSSASVTMNNVSFSRAFKK